MRLLNPVVTAAATVACGVLLTSPATAAVSIEAEAVRSFALPEGFSLQGARVLGDAAGKTFVYKTTGEQEQAVCTVLVADDAGAQAFDYTYGTGGTTCVGVIPHPDAGFFVRTDKTTAEEGEVAGSTAYVDAQGEVVWAVAEADVFGARPESEGGTGEFIGSYGQPHPAMAYSPEFDKLMAFTVGALNLGAETKQVTQAHVVNANTGTLRVTGQTFGTNGVGFVGGTAVRATDGYFLLYIYSAGDQGAFFYSYNGRNGIDAFEPLGEDWSSRYVKRMIYGPDNFLHLLWTPTDQHDAQTHVTVVDDQATQVWNASFDPVAQVGQAQVDLGQPTNMWVGSRYSVVLYGVDGALYLRVVDVITGESLGVAPLDGVTDYAPVELLNGADGRLKLLAYDEAASTLREYRLSFEGLSDGGGDAGGGDAGGADAGGSGSGGGEEGGCAIATSAGPRGAAAPGRPLGWLAVAATILAMCRRRD